MILELIVAVLAAFGILSLGWCLAGRLLSSDTEEVHRYPVRGDAPELEQMVRRHRWRQRSGLAGRLVIVDEGMTPDALRRAALLCRDDVSVTLQQTTTNGENYG